MTFPVPTRACSELLAGDVIKKAAGAARSIESCIAMSRQGGGRGRGPRDCDEYKYLGKCDKQGTTCTFRHEVVARYAIDGHRA